VNITPFLLLIRNALKIASSITQPERSLGNSESEIIHNIHQIRFHPQNSYLTTGGHFSDLFVRNMGIFYNALLDPRIPSTELDWQNRQEICYKTVKLALQSFIKEGTDATTISFLDNTFALLNIYSRASDSLYAILYGLKMLTDMQTTLTRYPSTNSPAHHRLDTHIIQKTNELITKHRNELKTLIEKYLNEVIDPDTNLIRKNIHLSSARDGIKRQSSFYDNVIAWSTIQLALELDIPINEELYNSHTQDLRRQKIVQTFWNVQTGIFNDDLATNSFSADQLIVISTQFLNAQKPIECHKLHSIISYIQNHQLDQPFPLQYSNDHQPSKLYWPVRHFAPNYMTHTIWSHWGMEYIKLLILLSSTQPNYIDQAATHLQSYKQNIEKFGGYPECYSLNGLPYRERLYRTVLDTSWVINYEQAKMLYNQYLS
jgi:hypothetical protein